MLTLSKITRRSSVSSMYSVGLNKRFKMLLFMIHSITALEEVTTLFRSVHSHLYSRCYSDPWQGSPKWGPRAKVGPPHAVICPASIKNEKNKINSTWLKHIITTQSLGELGILAPFWIWSIQHHCSTSLKNCDVNNLLSEHCIWMILRAEYKHK